MATYTEHYGLHQWVPEDDFLRTDFNEDLLKIDTALAAMNGLTFGTYTGDDTEERFISLGFTPKAVYVCTEDGIAGTLEAYEYCYGGLAFTGHPVRQTVDIIAIETNGFRVYQPNRNIRTNLSNETYYYAAVR